MMNDAGADDVDDDVDEDDEHDDVDVDEDEDDDGDEHDDEVLFDDENVQLNGALTQLNN